MSAVKKVSTQQMGVRNGKTSTGNQLQNTLDFCMGVSMQLMKSRKRIVVNGRDRKTLDPQH